jgi:hypothetical protein
MRSLIALGLTVCIAGSAAAQTEVIIRQPGEKDRVIHLDSARTKEAIAKVEAELTRAAGMMKTQAGDLQLRLTELQRAGEPLRLNTLALKNSELAAENWLAPMMKHLSATMRQPHLGIGIDTRPRDSDKYGAYIMSVTPGSPAEKAGIMSGDIILRIAGKSLTQKDGNDDSGPGVRLISIIATLAVGKPVDVELRRGTQNKTLKITPNEDEEGMVARLAPSVADFRLPMDRLMAPSIAVTGEMASRAPMAGTQGFSLFGPNSGTFSYSFGSNGLFAAYELAPLNEKLGAYFGTTEGVLVVNTGGNRVVSGKLAAMPRDVVARKIWNQGQDTTYNIAATPRAGAMARTTHDTVVASGIVREYAEGTPLAATMYARKQVDLGLEPGDVIVSVDGRKVTSPSQLMRIVGTYDHNDEFKLQIMRQKHAETLSVKMP